ncbi:hypothetical protein A8139_05560 [Marinomonas primoryensis]|uniref:Uncharacterized protein n=1 Tax=Marinomonas primoryensis TaxID=178399 RepID=A0A2Z4PPK4_9GAMM|nr:head completion/stabilization protein [Marinomonas primoryensis]AWX99517.1 hypothetical protein A8139_05560 [Marinomonas primoryensis]
MSLTGKPSLTTAAPVANDGFWPDLSLSDLMDRYRIPSEYADDTISWGLSLALVRVNEQLDRAKNNVLAMPFESFDAYLESMTILYGKPALSVHYEHAVYSYAKAFLLQQFSTMNRRKEAVNEAKESAETEQYWLDESKKSVAAIMRKFFPEEEHSTKANFYVELM